MAVGSSAGLGEGGRGKGEAGKEVGAGREKLAEGKLDGCGGRTDCFSARSRVLGQPWHRPCVFAAVLRMRDPGKAARGQMLGVRVRFYARPLSILCN